VAPWADHGSFADPKEVVRLNSKGSISRIAPGYASDHVYTVTTEVDTYVYNFHVINLIQLHHFHGLINLVRIDS
jgi:hypothetical protein